MYNDYILKVATLLFTNRLKQLGDIARLTDDVARQQADASIAIARIFFERVQATLPREKPFELLDDADFQAND